MSDKAPIKMLHDRLLVEVDREAGERRSSGGIVIPATAAMGARRLVWSRVVALRPARPRRRDRRPRAVRPRGQVRGRGAGRDVLVMRERDVHAVAAERLGDSEQHRPLPLTGAHAARRGNVERFGAL